MKKKLLGLVTVLCMVLFLVPVQMFSAATPADVTIDVGMENTENDDYKVMDNAINIRKDGIVYELTGTTDRKIQMWGSNDLNALKTFYLRLNGAALNSGITITNTSGAKLVLEVCDGTENIVSRVYAVDLTISGKGKITSNDLGATQSKDERNLSALHITDTEIVVNQLPTAGDSSQWNGTCLLDGLANVTYISNTSYPALRVGQTYGVAHSLTMKDNAKLYCLQGEGAELSQWAVDGITVSGEVKLQDNAYLEAEGRDSLEGGYLGSALIPDGNVTVEGNATLKATAYGSAIATFADVITDGGNLIADSKKSNGIYANNVIIKNGNAEISGYYPAVYAESSISFENSKLKITSSGDAAVYCANGAITVNGCIADFDGAEGYYGICANGGVNVSDSWIKTSGPETLDDAPDSIANSVLFNGNEGKVVGNAAIPGDVAVENGMTLDIPEGTVLTVPEGKTFTNNGTINVVGTIVRDGTIICNSHIGGTATCTAKAVCDVCLAEYGEINADNHTGEKVWSTDEKTHSQKWDCCGTVTVAEENHEWKDGKCEECGYACAHKGGEATCTAKPVCEICGSEYGEINADNHTGEKVWSTDEKTHSQKWDCCGTVTVAEENHEWKDGKCEECGYACAHKGGEATCTAKPVCEICGSEYGEINTVNHAGLKHFEGTPATTEREGNIEYWFCEDCGKYFADQNGTKEISKNDTVVAKLEEKTESGSSTEPSSDTSKTGSDVSSVVSNVSSNTSGEAQNPKSGESGALAAVAMLALSAGALIVFKRKR